MAPWPYCPHCGALGALRPQQAGTLCAVCGVESGGSGVAEPAVRQPGPGSSGLVTTDFCGASRLPPEQTADHAAFVAVWADRIACAYRFVPQGDGYVRVVDRQMEWYRRLFALVESLLPLAAWRFLRDPETLALLPETLPGAQPEARRAALIARLKECRWEAMRLVDALALRQPGAEAWFELRRLYNQPSTPEQLVAAIPLGLQLVAQAVLAKEVKAGRLAAAEEAQLASGIAAGDQLALRRLGTLVAAGGGEMAQLWTALEARSLPVEAGPWQSLAVTAAGTEGA